MLVPITDYNNLLFQLASLSFEAKSVRHPVLQY